MKWVVVFAFAFAGLVLVHKPADAAGGRCKWEGGPGASQDTQCKAEDCKGAGGLAECTKGEGVSNSNLGPDGWAFGACDDQGPTIPGAIAWCTAAGGTWNMGMCLNLPPGMLSAHGSNNWPQILSVAETWLHYRFSNPTLSTDTGWGTNYVATACGGGPPAYSLGVLTSDFRARIYDTNGAPQPTFGIQFHRTRTVRCPAGYQQRTTSAGVSQCFRPAELSCHGIGNPVVPSSGAKRQIEVDYRPGAQTQLQFGRRYNSMGYYRPSGLIVNDVETEGNHLTSDHWRHTYDRRLLLVAANLEIQALAVREDGEIRSFDLSGEELENRNGAGSQLQSLPNGTWKLTLADRSTELYDSSGRLQTITSSEGQSSTLAYNSAGRLTTVTGPFGHALQLDYNDHGQLSALTLPDSSSILYGYDNFDRLTRVTYADGTQKQYHYEDAKYQWALTGITDEDNQRYATYTYDAQGRATISEHAGGANRYEFSYDTSNATTVIDPLGAERILTFANASGLRKATSSSMPGAGCGIVKASSFDANGNVSNRTDFNDNQTQYAFNPVRNLETSRTEGVGSDVASTITTEYHQDFRLPTHINEPGRQTRFTYDTIGNVLSRTVLDTTTDRSRTWTYTYNSQGQMLTSDGPRSDVNDVTTYTYHACTYGAECGQVATVENAAGHVTTYLTYNAHGQPLTMTDANNVLTTLTYNSRQRIQAREVTGEITSFSYYPTGLLKRVTLPDGSYFEHFYDAAHRLVRTQDTEGNYISYMLDASGNSTVDSVYDPSQTLARTRGRVYDELGRLLSDIDATNNSVSYTYDANGNVETTTDQEGRSSVFGYDALNRQRTVFDPAGGFVEYHYSDRDELTQVTDQRSLSTVYTYNGLGDQQQLNSADTGVQTFTHNAAGSLHKSTDARGQTATYSYDSLERVTQIAYSDQTIGLTYDQGTYGKGRLTHLTDASGSTQWNYDAHGRVLTKQQTTDSVNLAVGYSYDTTGHLVQISTPSGQSIGFTYENGRVVSITVNSAALLSNVLYSPFGPTRGWNWGNGMLAVREYDKNGRVITIDSTGLSTYQYHDDGSIKSWSEDGNAPVSGTSGLTEFDVDPTSNQLLSSYGTQVRSYSYDNAGNILSDGPRSFTYNGAGRMVTATNGSVSAMYSINGLGQRVRKTVSGQSRYFIYDEQGHLLGEYNGAGGLIQETVWLDDIPVATLRSSDTGVTAFYIHTDHTNTPRRISRPADNGIVWRWDSDPFGSTAATEDPGGDGHGFVYALRFPGQYFDEETGLHYNYFRDYDPQTGRYVQSDPIGLKGGINTYAYVRNRPVSLVDPRGLCPCSGGSWSVDAGDLTLSAAFGGYVSFGAISFTCKSTPSTKCQAQVFCIGGGAIVGGGASFSITGSVNGARDSRDLSGWSGWQATGSVGPVGGQADGASGGGVGIGPSAGAGIAAMKCNTFSLNCQCNCEK